jgi:hypothetical protein
MPPAEQTEGNAPTRVVQFMDAVDARLR